jgi:hypothetical protein
MRTTMLLGPVLTLALSASLPGCFAATSGTGAPATSNRAVILAAGGGIEASQMSDPYVKGCADYVALIDPKIRGALDGAQGKSKSASGQQHQQASAVLTKLLALNVSPRVDVPQRGFPMVKTAVQDQIVALTAGGTASDPKKMMALSQKFAKANPMVLELNSQLFEVFMAYNQASVLNQVASAWPLAAAVAMGNAARHGLIADDKDKIREQVRAVALASRRVQIRGATIIGLYAEYQAAVAGATPPSGLDDTVAASLASLDADPEVSDAEIDGIMALADQAVTASAEKEAELKALAERTLRPSPGKASGDALQAGVGGSKGSIATSVVGLLGSIATGNVMGIVQNAAALVPADNPLGAAISGVAAVARGDYKGALAAAAKIAPGTPVGRAISAVNDVTKTVTGMVDQAKAAKGA